MDYFGGDFGFARGAALLSLLLAFWFVWRQPVANLFVPLTMGGIGGASVVGELSYGKVSMIVGVLTVVSLLLRMKGDGIRRLLAFYRSPLFWFLGVCALITLKIALEILLTGMNEDRTLALKAALMWTIFPAVVILLGLAGPGVEETERQMILGMAVYPVAVMAGMAPYLVSEGAIAAALEGTSRLTVGLEDTIRSARTLSFGFLGWLVLYSAWQDRARSLTLLAASSAFGFLIFVLLTGNRQFLITVLLFSVIWAFRLQRSFLWRVASGLLIVGLGAYTAYKLVGSGQIALQERLTAGQLEWEGSYGRGDIWLEVYESTLQHPWLGTGFRNFGRINAIRAAGSSEVIFQKDAAHGSFQDVFAEHGAILGLAFLLGTCHLVVRAFRRANRAADDNPYSAGLTLALIASIPPLAFSGMFLHSTAIVCLLILSLAHDAEAALAVSDGGEVSEGTMGAGSAAAVGTGCVEAPDHPVFPGHRPDTA